MKKDGTIKSIIEMIFIRNVLFWLGSLLSFYFINKAGLSDFIGTILSFILGMLFAVITIPIDMAATHNCGDDIHCSTIERIKKIIKEGNGYAATYHGSAIRILQMAIFTTATAITEIILR
jgi:branched-subunit amino acid transport protein